MSLTLKRKPRDKPAAYTRPAKKQNITNDTPCTSAQPLNKCSNSCQNLTLADWLSVYTFIDAHPHATQADIVRHFKSLPTACIDDNPNVLSAKWLRVVTRPDHMEHKGETVTSHMLCEKWKRFENEFDVPEKERLLGEAWVQSFCKAYKLRERCQHGETGSVDPKAVELERECCHRILAKFALQDWWNFDETSFFP
ncbi:uncharacterized protein BJ212DRAFT_1450457 [Suillus subaureus]|uniref:HTH CENPB-type domain-containing protein n=1 Tax=Suillus subaureus TaxID=48587 RepID=A0A9P7DL88_9AGAM|nr:uncharacterized protein BJ212DRAFT_1450457 [Suillus subaureus]KAG1797601.1 hypothetical protein BJ212DRAFT_1450457 [Suillus subaureus]